MAVADLTDWIDMFGREGVVWYAKRLAANDTLATKANQAGPYIAKEFLFEMFPEMNRPEEKNPDTVFEFHLDSHISELSHRQIRAVWYNQKTRNESRFTRFGGIESAVLNPESTGTLTIFAFVRNSSDTQWICHCWVCDDEVQSDLFEERLGPVEPGEYVIWRPGMAAIQGDLFSKQIKPHGSCWLTPDQIPDDWLIKFPTGREIVKKTIELRPATATNVDTRLLRRRDCEYEIFKSVEQEFYLDQIKSGFDKMDDFVSLANTVLQSRKSRSGKSLEYHTIEILREEGFEQDRDFAWNVEIHGKRPDFLFPSKDAYLDDTFPAGSLTMLAAKTTCKDRWRQIRNEVDRDRIPTLHLLTLQEGVSENQFSEMEEEGVQLVVPEGLHNKYPKNVRPRLASFETFLTHLRH
ncbi:type II restriction endonuclease [Parasphingorhabdus sp.]|uniref:type II restriction endonuclease n=1 Tax=Parasphingorhabdus sp. TaxID=2709688 RepID=UPI003BAEFC98